jgi:hypothetical protein
MLAVMKVFGRVFVPGGIATPYFSAYHAQPQVDPGVAQFHAFFANMRFGILNFDLIQVFAFC